MIGRFPRRPAPHVALWSGLVLALAVAAPAAPALASSPGGCAVPAAGQVGCAALVTQGSVAMTPDQVAAAATAPPGYSPQNLRSAYGLDFSALAGGAGQTVAVVTA